MSLKKVYSLYKEAYSGLPKEAWLLAVVEFINRSGSMVLFFMTLYMTRDFNFSTTQAGQAISGYGLGALLGSYLGGKLTDVIGAYNVQKLSLILTGTGFILLGQMKSYWFIWGMMFFVGLVGEALHPANSTAISQVCPPGLRTKGFALNRLATNVGVTIGPAVGGYLAIVDYRLLFWVDGMTCFLAVAAFMLFFKTARPAQEPRDTPAPTPRSVWKDFYFLKVLVFSFLLAVVFVQLFNTFPLFFRSVYGFKENRIGLLITINTIMIVLVEMLLMDALKGKSLKKIISLGMLLFGTGFAFALAVTVGPSIGAVIYDSLGPDFLWFGCGGMGILLFLGFISLKEKGS